LYIPDQVNAMKKLGRPLRVCYFGTYRSNYIRNRLMIDRLRNQGIELVECHERLWHGVEDRERVASGGWMNPRFWWRMIITYIRLLWRYHSIGSYDVLVVGYPGQLDIPLARILSWLRRRPLVWDVLMSIHLIALERKLEERSRFTVQLIHSMESFACHLPDLLILDTDVYASWFKQTYNIPENRIRLVPLGADDRVFKPIKSERTDKHFRCIYYGTFVPSHGLEYIVEAARLLAQEQSIQFELIGRGHDLEKIQALTDRYGLENVTFTEWMSETELARLAASADVILGTFGGTPQSLMTVQNKIYEGLAMAKPVITGDSPAVRQALIHGEQVYLCERENPKSLADAIRTLKGDPDLCRRLGQNGYQMYFARYDVNHIGQVYASHLKDLLFSE
jgi:glycosyltransferase involved in cell wall biosynthesis